MLENKKIILNNNTKNEKIRKGEIKMEENKNLNVNNNENIEGVNEVQQQNVNYNNTNSNKNKEKSKTIIIVVAIIIGLIIVAAIPVMLIMGGITTSLLLGDNGIFEKAREASERDDENQRIALIKEEIQLAAFEVSYNNYDYSTGKKTKTLTTTEVINEINEELDDDDSDYKLSSDGTVLENGVKVKDSKGNVLKANIKIDNTYNTITVDFE